LVVLLGLVLLVDLLVVIGGPDRPVNVALPGFTGSARSSSAPAPIPRSTLLAAECPEDLPGPISVAALLGQPVDSVGVRSVRGVPAPSVGLLERVSCTYQRNEGAGSSNSAGPARPVLVVTVAAFRDACSASQQRLRNLAAEQAPPSATSPVPVPGATETTLLDEPAASVLMMDAGRYTLAATLPHGLFPHSQEPSVLADLTGRLLTAILPSPDHQPALPAGPCTTPANP
jgi:hypothetical protein